MQVDRQGNECMRSILVFIGGGERDEVIIRTAHAAAVPLGAHLEFLHVRVSAPVAMRHDEHAQFAMAPVCKARCRTSIAARRKMRSAALSDRSSDALRPAGQSLLPSAERQCFFDPLKGRLPGKKPGARHLVDGLVH